MSAVVADRMSGDKHNPNVELVAQGIANVASPLFGGLPATGAIARTATNIRTGGRTPVSGMVHALTLLAVLLFAAPLAAYIPMPVLAGILMIVSYTMGEWGQIPELLRLTRPEIAVWAVTFALTVFADLTVAVEAGMILAVFLFLRTVTTTTTVLASPRTTCGRLRPHPGGQGIPSYVAIYRVHGPFLFGSTDKIAAIADDLAAQPPIVVLRLRNMTALDATGLLAFEDLAERLRHTGRALLVCGAPAQPRALMERSGFAAKIGRDNLCDNVLAALERARQLHQAGQGALPAPVG
jgi:SulP family sulfate permease